MTLRPQQRTAVRRAYAKLLAEARLQWGEADRRAERRRKADRAGDPGMANFWERQREAATRHAEELQLIAHELSTHFEEVEL